MPAPDQTSNYYIVTSYGGWNPCIQGNTAHGLQPFPGSVLPNCSGFATGRFNELLGNNNCNYLGNANGGDFMRFAFQQGLDISIDPIVGGAMVWKNNGDGHVAIVEAIIDANTVQTSESGWDWTLPPAWDYRTHSRGTGNWHWNSTYRYQGCICPPGVPGSLNNIIGTLMGAWREEDY